mmetsp:Transcript_33306/g.52067  ORF Transcript_33306/g.52067 Transcript_33306/m.52067 type:complete len:800 (-) Transcript_33306:103-2502(-)
MTIRMLFLPNFLPVITFPLPTQLLCLYSLNLSEKREKSKGVRKHITFSPPYSRSPPRTPPVQKRSTPRSPPNSSRSCLSPTFPSRQQLDTDVTSSPSKKKKKLIKKRPVRPPLSRAASSGEAVTVSKLVHTPNPLFAPTSASTSHSLSPHSDSKSPEPFSPPSSLRFSSFSPSSTRYDPNNSLLGGVKGVKAEDDLIGEGLTTGFNDPQEVLSLVLSFSSHPALLGSFLSCFEQFGMKKETLFNALLSRLRHPEKYDLPNPRTFTKTNTTPTNTTNLAKVPPGLEREEREEEEDGEDEEFTITTITALTSLTSLNSNLSLNNFSISPTASSDSNLESPNSPDKILREGIEEEEEQEEEESFTITALTALNPLRDEKKTQDPQQQQQLMQQQQQAIQFLLWEWMGLSGYLYFVSDSEFMSNVFKRLNPDPYLRKIKEKFLSLAVKTSPGPSESSSVMSEGDSLSLLLAARLFEEGVSEREIAEKITAIMWKIFRSVAPSELFDGAWQGKERETRAPNLHKLGCIFNRLSALCAISIVNSCDEQRLGMLTKVIQLAYHLKKMRNYEGMAAVGAVFNWASVKRLKPLWSSLPKKVKAKKNEIEGLLLLSNHAGSMKQELEQVQNEEPFIPFIAPRLRQLRYLYDIHQEKMKNSDGIVDFSVLLRTGRIIYELLRYKERKYHFSSTSYSTLSFVQDATLTKTLTCSLVIEMDDLEDMLFEKSRQIYSRRSVIILSESLSEPDSVSVSPPSSTSSAPPSSSSLPISRSTSPSSLFSSSSIPSSSVSSSSPVPFHFSQSHDATKL